MSLTVDSGTEIVFSVQPGGRVGDHSFARSRGKQPGVRPDRLRQPASARIRSWGSRTRSREPLL